MITMLHFAALVITTLFAAAGAAAFNWLLLQATFLMMRPATAKRIAGRTPLVRGTGELARSFAGHR
jgi:hypothetical protein